MEQGLLQTLSVMVDIRNTPPLKLKKEKEIRQKDAGNIKPVITSTSCTIIMS